MTGMPKPVLQRRKPFEKKECVRCDDPEFRIDGYCSVYCRDMDELEQTIKKVWAVLVKRKGDVAGYLPQQMENMFAALETQLAECQEKLRQEQNRYALIYTFLKERYPHLIDELIHDALQEDRNA